MVKFEAERIHFLGDVFAAVAVFVTDLATEQERQLKTARANQRTGLTNRREAN